MKNEIDNCYINIQGWMRSKLQLKGNELLTFALIYGFCMDAETQFVGSVSYVTEWIGCDKSTTKRILQTLQDKNLVIKIPYEVQGVTFNKFAVNFAEVEKCRRGVQNTPEGGAKYTPRGVQNTPHIICNDNIVDNIVRGPQKVFCEPHTQQTDQKDLFSGLDNSQEYVWVNSPEIEEKESFGKEKEVKERKTLFENSDYCKELSQKSEEEREKILVKDFPDLKEINIDLLYYFEVVKDWSNSSNTKRTARGWKSTIRNFVRGDKEKNKVHFKINPQEPQQTDGGLTDEQKWYLNLGNM